jgi:hypothetical protein
LVDAAERKEILNRYRDHSRRFEAAAARRNSKRTGSVIPFTPPAALRELEQEPTARWALDRVRDVVRELPIELRADCAWEEADRIVAQDVAINHSIGTFGLELLHRIAHSKPGPVNVMTHCNAGALATCAWGTATSPVFMAHAQGLPVHVWISETRPRLQGANLTAWECDQRGIPHTLFSDVAAGLLMRRGDVDVVLEYNGDIAQAMVEDKDIDFVVPKEGSQLNSDNLCIPKGAPHPKNAHAFINYILDANVDKEITETILYPTPNAAAKALMPDSYKNNPVIFTPADILAKCEYARFNPELQPLYE